MLVQTLIEIFRGKADVEKMKLYKVLKNLKIPFKGIDLPKGEYEKHILQGSANEAVRLQNEPIRVGAMVANIFKTISRGFSSGGILIVSTGMQHARRLGANLLLEHRKNSNSKMDIKHPSI